MIDLKTTHGTFRGAPVPDDYERHYCTDDGEDWPCGAARAARVPEAAS